MKLRLKASIQAGISWPDVSQQMPEDAHRLGLHDFLRKYEVAVLPQHMDLGVETVRVIHDFRNAYELDPSEWEDWEDVWMTDSQPKIDQMVKDIQKGETLPPVIVEGLKDDPKYRQQVLDGHHRTKAYQLAHKLIPVIYTLETLIEFWHKQRNQATTRKQIIEERNGYLEYLAREHKL